MRLLKKQNIISPYTEVFIAAGIWGCSGPIVKYLSLPSFTLSFFRVLLPTLFSLAIILFVLKKKPFMSKWMTIASFLNAGRMLLYFMGFNNTTVGNAVITLYTWPIFASIWGVFILKESFNVKRGILLTMAFGGIILIASQHNFSFESKDFIGITSMLGSALLYSISLMIYKLEAPKLSPWESIFLQNYIGPFIFLPLVLFFHPFPDIQKIVEVSIYSLITGVLGFGLFFHGLKKIRASDASLLSYNEVLTGTILGVLLLNEVFTWNLFIGGILIIAASTLARLTKA